MKNLAQKKGLILVVQSKYICISHHFMMLKKLQVIEIHTNADNNIYMHKSI